MASKQFKSLLILFATLSISFAHDFSNGATCTHGQNGFPAHEFLDIPEENFPVPEEGRVLQSYSNLRPYGYYGFLSGSFQTYFETSLGPAVLDYFSSALQVKYPVSGRLSYTGSSVCGLNTPSVLKSGVDADFFIMWDAQYQQPASQTASIWVAESYSCILATGTKRPLIAKTLVNSAVLVNPGSDILLHEKNIYMILHETTHTLGFSTSLYPYFIDDNGNRLSGHITSGSLDGSTSVVINVEPLTNRLRTFFGCSTLKGAYMENSGSSATAGEHFERRQFAFEAMTSGLIYQQSYSQFSLAMLEGSGWYVPNYDYADPYWMGQGNGCNFLFESCSSADNQFSDFCTGSSRGCTVPGRGGGFCQSDIRSDGCKFNHPEVNYDCDNTAAAGYTQLSHLQSFGREAYAKCFEGTLSDNSYSSSSTYCFQYNCVGSGSNTRLEVTVGSETLTCTEEGSMSVSGYHGYVKCPDPLTFCSTVGAPVCPRGCMGRGSCVNGRCECNSGFSGKDCAAI